MTESAITEQIAAAIICLAQRTSKKPKIDVTVQLHNGRCSIYVVCDKKLSTYDVADIVHDLAGYVVIRYRQKKHSNK